MEQKNIDTELFFWETPEVELRYRRYGDAPSDVIKKVKYDIEYFLTTPNLDEERSATITDENGNERIVNYNIREVYSAIYNALNYYKNASYYPDKHNYCFHKDNQKTCNYNNMYPLYNLHLLMQLD